LRENGEGWNCEKGQVRERVSGIDVGGARVSLGGKKSHGGKKEKPLQDAGHNTGLTYFIPNARKFCGLTRQGRICQNQKDTGDIKNDALGGGGSLYGKKEIGEGKNSAITGRITLLGGVKMPIRATGEILPGIDFGKDVSGKGGESDRIPSAGIQTSPERELYKKGNQTDGVSKKKP